MDELGFGWRCRLVFVQELAAMGFVGVSVLGGENGRGGGKAMAQGVERGALFAGLGAGAGGVLGVGAIDGRAVDGWD